MNADDTQLMGRLRAGEEKALAELLDRHWEHLVRYAHSLLSDWDKAEDVAQEAYVRVWANRDGWAVGSSIALLYRITRNAALDVLKSVRHRQRTDGPEDLPSRDASDSAVEEAELETAVIAAVSSLPARRQEVFRMVREHGLSYAEIGETMSLSRQTVANHMSLALRDLRVMLRLHLPIAGDDERGADPDANTSSDTLEGHP